MNNIFLHYCTLPGCNKKFKNRFALERHMLSHTKEKPFACPICGKAFALKQYLKEHESIHKNVKPLVCGIDGCTLSFRGAAQLSRHRRCHTNYKTREYDYSLNNNYPMKRYCLANVNESPSKVFETYKPSSDLNIQNEGNENNMISKIKIEENELNQNDPRNHPQDPKSNKNPVFYISKISAPEKKDLTLPFEDLSKSNSVSTTLSNDRDDLPSNEKDLEDHQQSTSFKISIKKPLLEDKVNEEEQIQDPSHSETNMISDPHFKEIKESKPYVNFEFPKLSKSIYEQALQIVSHKYSPLQKPLQNLSFVKYEKNMEENISIPGRNSLDKEILHNCEQGKSAFSEKNEQNLLKNVSPSSSKTNPLCNLLQANPNQNQSPMNNGEKGLHELQNNQPIRPLPIHVCPTSAFQNSLATKKNDLKEKPLISKDGIETPNLGSGIIESTSEPKDAAPHYFTYTPYLLLYNHQLKVGQVVGHLPGPSFSVPNPQMYSLYYNEWVQNFQKKMCNSDGTLRKDDNSCN